MNELGNVRGGPASEISDGGVPPATQAKMRFAQIDQLVGNDRLMQDAPELSGEDSTLPLRRKAACAPLPRAGAAWTCASPRTATASSTS